MVGVRGRTHCCRWKPFISKNIKLRMPFRSKRNEGRFLNQKRHPPKKKNRNHFTMIDDNVQQWPDTQRETRTIYSRGTQVRKIRVEAEDESQVTIIHRWTTKTGRETGDNLREDKSFKINQEVSK